MYYAKEKGRNNFQFFKADMTTRAVARQSLEGRLGRALERHGFVLHDPPKVDLQTGEITGIEALLRWLHADRGLIPPPQFVPIAEESGLIVPIGRWVLREACTQLRAWLEVGLRRISVAVNLSGVEFRAKHFLEGVRTILEETRLEPRFLEFELTESVLMNHVEGSVSRLQALKALGVQLAVDDFGTGYSSLSYLRRFPIDALKLDQSFIHHITVDPNEAAIISAVIDMGKKLKQRVIAEGVETREQRNFLQVHGCGEGHRVASFGGEAPTGVDWRTEVRFAISHANRPAASPVEYPAARAAPDLRRVGAAEVRRPCVPAFSQHVLAKLHVYPARSLSVLAGGVQLIVRA